MFYGTTNNNFRFTQTKPNFQRGTKFCLKLFANWPEIFYSAKANEIINDCSFIV